MDRKAIVIVLLLLGTAAGVVAKEKGKKPKLPHWKHGEQSGTVTIAGKKESFTALVPRGYSPKRKWPVVLLAHGNGGHAASFLRRVKPSAGKRPPLLVSLERCDNHQDAVGYVPKYLDELTKVFSIDEEKVFALGFSGGGFRLWDDIICKAEVLPKFRGVILVGCGKQSFDPPKKPEKAPTVVLVGDPKDPNYGKHGPVGKKLLEAKGYEVIVHEHKSGHTVPAKELKLVFKWIAKVIREKKKKKK